MCQGADGVHKGANNISSAQTHCFADHVLEECLVVLSHLSQQLHSTVVGICQLKLHCLISQRNNSTSTNDL